MCVVCVNPCCFDDSMPVYCVYARVFVQVQCTDMCAYKRVSAKKTHVSTQEPHFASLERVMTCLQVCVHVWCITVCLPECSKSVRSDNLMSDLKIVEVMRCKRAPYLRERASFCTLMRSETWLFSNSCMSLETCDLEFQKPLVCRSLCKCKETHVAVLMLACTLSTARLLSKRHAHVYEDCEHTTCVLRSNCYKHGPSFYVSLTASTPIASEDYVCIYLGQVSIYNESRPYICGLYMD